jgi:hypothetical protein
VKQKFLELRIGPEKRAIIDTANQVIANYRNQGLTLTLRQLYYQYIARDLFPASWIDPEYNAKQGLDPTTKNTVKNYKKLGTVISDGRLAGLIDWDAIEDRGRQPRLPVEWESIDQLMEGALAAYRLPRWKGQKNYVELWVEKDALSGVLQPLARQFHVTLMVNKGYSSQSAMHESSERFIAAEDDGRHSVLFYLGDHDPSGEDMVRDIQDRLRTFGSAVIVEKLAITMPQIRQYNPPPNPAKMSDSRAEKYVAEHGDESWEVDALPPEVLNGIIRTAFTEVLDDELMDEVKADEEKDKVLIREAVARLRKRKK